MLSNTLWMYVIQLSAFVFPLLTTPYLARTLSPVPFGVFIYAQTMGQLISLVIEYGFDFTGTRSVATASSPGQRWKLLYGVQTAKLMIAIVCIMISWPLLQYDPVINHDALISAGVMLTALSTGLNLNWFFQGIERLALAGKINFSIRILSTACILFFVQGPQDAFLALFLFAMANIVTTTVMYLVLFRLLSDHAIHIDSPVRLLRASFNVFISTFMNQLQIRLITLFVGFFNPGPLVGYFGGAYRLATIIVQATQPVMLVVYPRIASMISEKHPRTRSLWTLVFVGGTIGLTVSSFGMISLSDKIIYTMLGPEFAPAVPIFCWYVIAIQLVIMNRLLLNLWAMPNRRDQLVRNLYLSSSMGNIAIGFFMSQYYPGTGTVIAICVGELMLMLCTLSCFYRLNIWPFISLSAPVFLEEEREPVVH